MHLLAQGIPDPSKVIDKASGVSWEAGMVAFVMVCCMGVIVYMIKRQNDNVSAERQVAAEREERMAKRMNDMEDKLHLVEKENSTQLLITTKEMASAIAQSTAAQITVREALSELTQTNNVINGDLKELCALLKLSPCIALGHLRGNWKIVDDKGNEVKLQRPIT